ncbi:AMP deaminase [Tulasnella sp. JGI-2019a]|nr:AMP deaminase [Tulasnella sp. JGI-2019a]KAG9037017.1 AMP deaminase [Tulasnella sp. JGI-2019a]
MKADSIINSNVTDQVGPNGGKKLDISLQTDFATKVDKLEEAHGLDIPQYEPRDGLFDYREEQTMMKHHVQPGAWPGSQGSPTRTSFVEDTSKSEASRRNSIMRGELPSKPLIQDWMKNQEGADQESEILVEQYIGTKTHLPLSPELKELYRSFQKCLHIRDKYMKASLQRLGDNPRDHDGVFKGFDNDACDVSGVRHDVPEKDLAPAKEQMREPWKIYPEPPPPHWRWKADTDPVPADHSTRDEPRLHVHGDNFDFSKCVIPEADPCTFHLDDMGVYQVYDDLESEYLMWYHA